jgi:hypothetical protein
MSKSKSLLGLAVVVAIFFALSAAAQAEFKSVNKATSGRSEALLARIEAGGATISCGETETKGAPEWTIENAGKAVTAGPSLHLGIKTWGTCATEVEGETRSVSSGECEMEAKQPKEEETVSVTVLSTCTYKFETKKSEICEIKVAPLENSERSYAALADGGEQAENLSIELALTGITTTVKGSCEASGIKATHTAKLTGFVESLEVVPQRPNPLWAFGLAPGTMSSQFYGLGRSATVQLINRQAVASAGPGTLLTAAIEANNVNTPYFTIANRTVPECQTFAYERNGGGANDRCMMRVKYEVNSGITIRFARLEVRSAGNELEAFIYISASVR